MLWLGHWAGLIGEHLPDCSCLCSLCFTGLLYFHHSVSMAYFVSSGILSLLLCGFLTRNCFKIPCHTLSKNVRPGGWQLTPVLYLCLSGWLPTQENSQHFQSQQSLVIGINQCDSQTAVNLPFMGYSAASGDIFGYYNLEMLLVSTGWGPGMLLSTLQCTEQPPKTKTYLSTVSVVLGWRHSKIDIPFIA